VKNSENKEIGIDEGEDEKGLKSTKSLIQTFLQTVKAYRLYEAHHPILTKFLDRVKKDFDQYFEEFDSFSLQVGEYELLYRGNVVYESRDVKESLAFVFYKDGIREIRFIKGLEFREIMDFLDIVRKADFVNRREDDLVTLLWEQDFSHITFSTVEDFVEGGATFVPETEEDLMKGMEYKAAGEEGRAEVTEVQEDKGAITVIDELKKLLDAYPGQSLGDACQLKPEEMEAIKREIEEEEQQESLPIDHLIEILLHLGEDLEAYENMVAYFEKTLLALLDEKETEKVAMGLKALSETLEVMVLKDNQIFAVRRILQVPSNPTAVRRLGNVIKGNGEGNEEPILTCLRFLTKQAIEPLCLLLVELESEKWRKTIGDLLVELSKEEIQPLTKFLSHHNSSLICQILSILGKIGHPSTMKYLGNLTAHGDLKVREETLQVLSQFGKKSVSLILRYLKDSVPDIRSKASLVLARVAKEEAAEPLMKIILLDDFYKRGYEEKVAFFRALGETGSKRAIPILKELATKRKLFQREKWEEMRICASNALKMIEARDGARSSRAEDSSPHPGSRMH
jgi:hypothetical protein